MKLVPLRPLSMAEHFKIEKYSGGNMIPSTENPILTLDYILKTEENKYFDRKSAQAKPTDLAPVFSAFSNAEGSEDRILLFHISPDQKQVVHTQNGSTYLRIGDRSKELKGEDLLNLEYSKNTRYYEDEINLNAKMADLDATLLETYWSEN